MKEINLIGGFYLSKSRPWASQDVVNWIPVKSVVGGTRSPMKLRGVPGLRGLSINIPLPPGVRYSSTIYPAVVIEEMASGGSVNAGLVRAGYIELAGYIEAADSFGTITGGELRLPLRTYAWPAEAVDSTGTIVDGVLRQILRQYNNWPAEAVDSSGTINGGEIKAILIQYNNWPAEAIDSSGTITDGTLT